MNKYEILKLKQDIMSLMLAFGKQGNHEFHNRVTELVEECGALNNEMSIGETEQKDGVPGFVNALNTAVNKTREV